MKKFGFTLAEVLVTLGIIGVVSAITLPTLMSNTTDAQIGPKLAKAVSAFEQANEALLNDKSSDTLTDARLLTSTQNYINELSRFMKITSTGNNTFISKDGFEYTLSANLANTPPNNPQAPAYQQRISTSDVIIDIDGPNAGRDQAATDLFYFTFWNDGSLRPYGGTNYLGTNNASNWQTFCPIGPTPNNADLRMCAGHIFENNLKVLYK